MITCSALDPSPTLVPCVILRCHHRRHHSTATLATALACRKAKQCVAMMPLLLRQRHCCYNVIALCISVYSRHLFLGGGGNPPQKNLQFPPQTAAKLCALNIFFRPGQRITNISQNFLLMDNKHRKLFVTKQSKGCKFMPKMHQNTFGSRAPPEPAGGAYALPQVP